MRLTNNPKLSVLSGVGKGWTVLVISTLPNPQGQWETLLSSPCLSDQLLLTEGAADAKAWILVKREPLLQHHKCSRNKRFSLSLSGVL